jgi:hypothetical protein
MGAADVLQGDGPFALTGDDDHGNRGAVVNGAQNTLHEIDGLRHHLYIFSQRALKMSRRSERSLDPGRGDLKHEGAWKNVVSVQGGRQVTADVDAVLDEDAVLFRVVRATGIIRFVGVVTKITVDKDAQGRSMLSARDLYVVEIEALFVDEGLNQRQEFFAQGDRVHGSSIRKKMARPFTMGRGKDQL